MALASRAPTNGAQQQAVRIEAVTAKTIDDFIVRINPAPTEDDASDILAIEKAVQRMTLRRNAQLVGVIHRKDVKIKELMDLLEKAHAEPPDPPNDSNEIPAGDDENEDE